jgi:hypothetical protein
MSEDEVWAPSKLAPLTYDDGSVFVEEFDCVKDLSVSWTLPSNYLTNPADLRGFRVTVWSNCDLIGERSFCEAEEFGGFVVRSYSLEEVWDYRGLPTIVLCEDEITGQQSEAAADKPSGDNMYWYNSEFVAPEYDSSTLYTIEVKALFFASGESDVGATTTFQYTKYGNCEQYDYGKKYGEAAKQYCGWDDQYPSPPAVAAAGPTQRPTASPTPASVSPTVYPTVSTPHPTAGVGGETVSPTVYPTPGETVSPTVYPTPEVPTLTSLIRRKDKFGSSASGIGYMDDDTYLDVAVGAPFDNDGRGAVYIVGLEGSGDVADKGEDIHKISSCATVYDTQCIQLEENDYFGSSVTSADVDADGIPDLLIGAPNDDDGYDDAGAVWLFMMDVTKGFNRATKISNANLGVELGASANFGSSASAMGDLDGDGFTEVAVGAPGTLARTPDGLVETGAVHILFLKGDGAIKRIQTLSSSDGWFRDGETFGLPLARGGRFGTSVAAIGDIDDNGVSDLAVGAPQAGSAAEGVIYILLLQSNGMVLEVKRISKDSDNFNHVLLAGAKFGISLAGLGDLDGAGGSVAAVAVGATGCPGTIYMIFLDNTGTIASEDGGVRAILSRESGTTSDANFGGSVANIGDLNGDGATDLMSGISESNDSKGAVQLLFLSPLCVAGSRINPDRDGSEACLACPAGSYQNLDGQTECIPCARGSYQGDPRQSSCIQCKSQTSCAEESLIEPAECQAGALCLNPALPEVAFPGTELGRLETTKGEVRSVGGVVEPASSKDDGMPNTVSFEIALTHAPTDNVTVTVTAATSITKPGCDYRIDADRFSLVDAESAEVEELVFTFAPHTFNTPQYVRTLFKPTTQYEGTLRVFYKAAIGEETNDPIWANVVTNTLIVTVEDTDDCATGAVPFDKEYYLNSTTLTGDVKTTSICQCRQTEYYLEEDDLDWCGSAIKCAACVPGMKCETANIRLENIGIEAGHYRASRDSANVVSCPENRVAACVGSDATSGSPSSPSGRRLAIAGDDLCEDGYRGPMCQICDESAGEDDATRYVWQGNECVECTGSLEAGAYLALIVLAFAVGLLGLFAAKLKADDRRKHEKVKDQHDTAVREAEAAVKSAQEALDLEEEGAQKRLNDAQSNLSNIHSEWEALEAEKAARTEGENAGDLDDLFEGAEGMDLNEKLWAKLESSVQTKYKIVLKLIQTLGQIALVYPVELPTVFTNSFGKLNFFSSFNLDIIPLNCVVDTNFHDSLLFMTLAPFGVLLVVMGVYILKTFLMQRAFDKEAEEIQGDTDMSSHDKLEACTEKLDTMHFQTKWLRAKCIYVSFIFVYSVFPWITTTIFLTFDHDDRLAEGGGSESYLRTDYRIREDDPVHQGYVGYAAIMLIVYCLGIPTLSYAIVRKLRTEIGDLQTIRMDILRLENEYVEMGHKIRIMGNANARNVGRDYNKRVRSGSMTQSDHRALNKLAHLAERQTELEKELEQKLEEEKEAVDAEPLLFGVSPLFRDYEPEYWWFEILQFLATLYLVGISQAWDIDGSTVVFLSLLVSFAMCVTFANCNPYLDSHDDKLAQVSQITISLSLMFGLMSFDTTANHQGAVAYVFAIFTMLNVMYPFFLIMYEFVSTLSPSTTENIELMRYKMKHFFSNAFDPENESIAVFSPFSGSQKVFKNPLPKRVRKVSTYYGVTHKDWKGDAVTDLSEMIELQGFSDERAVI